MWEAIYEKLKTIRGLGSRLFCILEYLLWHILFSNCLYTLFWQGRKQLVSLTQTLSQNRRAYITIDLLSRHGIRRVSRSAAGCFKHIVSSIDLSEEKVSWWNKRLEFGWADAVSGQKESPQPAGSLSDDYSKRLLWWLWRRTLLRCFCGLGFDVQKKNVSLYK